MDLKWKVRTYNFWISLASAVLLVLRLLGEQFGFEIDSNAFMDVVTAICGVLVMLGIIIMPATKVDSETKSKKTKKLKETVESIDQAAQEAKENLENQQEEGETPVSDAKDNEAEVEQVKEEQNLELEPQEEQIQDETACFDCQEEDSQEQAETQNEQVAKMDESITGSEVIDEKTIELVSNALQRVTENGAEENSVALVSAALQELAKSPEELLNLVEKLLKE